MGPLKLREGEARSTLHLRFLKAAGAHSQLHSAMLLGREVVEIEHRASL